MSEELRGRPENASQRFDDIFQITSFLHHEARTKPREYWAPIMTRCPTRESVRKRSRRWQSQCKDSGGNRICKRTPAMCSTCTITCCLWWCWCCHWGSICEQQRLCVCQTDSTNNARPRHSVHWDEWRHSATQICQLWANLQNLAHYAEGIRWWNEASAPIFFFVCSVCGVCACCRMCVCVYVCIHVRILCVWICEGVFVREKEMWNQLTSSNQDQVEAGEKWYVSFDIPKSSLYSHIKLNDCF